jgi:hypothetical protein
MENDCISLTSWPRPLKVDMCSTLHHRELEKSRQSRSFFQNVEHGKHTGGVRSHDGMYLDKEWIALCVIFPFDYFKVIVDLAPSTCSARGLGPA